jgi:acyl carrier protein
MPTTFERLSAVLINTYHFEPERLTLDAQLEALDIDSLGLTDLLFNIEDEFHVTLPAKPVELLNLGDVVQFIDQLIAAPSDTEAGASLVVTPQLRSA